MALLLQAIGANCDAIEQTSDSRVAAPASSAYLCLVCVSNMTEILLSQVNVREVAVICVH